jgi:hypothetical protein
VKVSHTEGSLVLSAASWSGIGYWSNHRVI